MKLPKATLLDRLFIITPLLYLVLVLGINSQALAGVDLEVPIEMVDHGLMANQDGAGTTNMNRSSIFLDPADYEGDAVNYYFEIVVKNTDSVNREVYLRRTTGGAADHATITVEAGTASFTRKRVALSSAPASGKQEYLVRLTDTSAGTELVVSAARVIVQQTNATKTRVQIPLVQKAHDAYAGGAGRADKTTSTTYTQGDPVKYSLWVKDSTKYATLSGSTPWTLEAVLDNDSATATTYAALHRHDTGEEVDGAEVSLGGDVITLVDASFSDGALNFTNGQEFELKIMTTESGQNAHLGRASLYVSLTDPSKAEVLYRVSRQNDGTAAEDIVEQRTLLDTSLFSNPAVYFEASGSCADNGPRLYLRDHGASPSGTGGSDVAGSEINFNSGSRTIVRTAEISPTSGNNFYVRDAASTDDLIPTHAWIVVTTEITTGIINESFEATGAYGYDEAGWTEVIDASCTLDANATPIPGTPPTGSGSECLKAIVLDSTSDNDAYAHQTKTDQTISYVQGYLYIDQEGFNNGEVFTTLGLYDTNSLRVAAIEIGQSAGVPVLRFTYWSNGVLNYTDLLNIALDTWYEVEYKYDITNLLWEIRINGVTKAIGGLLEPTRTPQKIAMGIVGYHGTAGATTLYTDLVAWHDSDWPEPTVCPTPGEPSGPTPANGLTGVSIDADLDWADSSDADSYNVYFGTDPSPPLYAEDVAESSLTLPTLEYCTRYYWGIVAKNSCGNSKAGVVWDFTTENGPPGTPGSPSPAHGETDVSADVILTWSECTGTDSYEVYLGTVPDPTTKVGEVSTNSYDPDIDWDTHYYWKIVAKNSCGSSTAGDIWEFTTGPQPTVDHYIWDASPSPGPPYDSWDNAAHTIAQGLGAASAGQTVMVRAGTSYIEHVFMKDGVDLVAEEGVKPSINYSPGFHVAVVELTGPMTCNLKGFDIRVGTNMGEGITLDGTNGQVNATIEDCTVHCDNMGVGIRFTGAVNTTITGCSVYKSGSMMRVGIGTSGFSNPDRIASGSSITIKNTTIGGSGQGMTVAGIRLRGATGDSNIQVKIGGSGLGDGNTISHNGTAGILLADIDQVSIENNDISNNGEAGILLVDSSTVSPHIKNNTIHHHLTAAGINIGGASSVTIGDNNHIYGNNTGIAFYVANNAGLDSMMDPLTKTVSAQPVTITGNNIYSNTYAGIAVRDGITGAVTITQNNIYSNTGGIRMQRKCTLYINRNAIHDNIRGGIHTGNGTADGGGFIAGQIGEAVLTIKKNKLYDNGGAGYGAGIDIRHASGTIYNNLVYRNYKGGIRFGDYITEIVNNTVLYNGNASGGGIVYDDLAGAVNDPPAGHPPAPLLIRNNICAYNETAGIRACFDNTSEERDYNLLYDNNNSGYYCSGRYMAKQLGGAGCDQPGGAEWATHDICGYEPQFVNTAIDDYHLQAGSPAENAGDDGNDMGAYGGSDPIVDSEIP